MEVNVALRSTEVAALNTINWEITTWQTVPEACESNGG